MATGPKTRIIPLPDSNKDLIIDLMTDWQIHKRQKRVSDALEKELNAQLSEVVVEQGQVDQHGHVWLHLPVPVTGFDTKGQPKDFNALERQRKVQMFMDEDVAIKVLETRGLLEDCSTSWVSITNTEKALAALEAAGLLEDSGIEVKTEVDEDKVRAAYFKGQLIQADYEEIFSEKYTYALIAANI